ncbi:MAG: hypothetical protein NZ455_06060 [Bacteroidia bacterium]|nr:hypothetical protein [Bacteroidia bacterium]MDW8345963.1 hypothetical protein [Bacteroidia bacterium]
MRHAEGVRQHGAKPLARALNPVTRGWAGGAQHRQPVARRPCGHERSVTPTRTRPKKTLTVTITFLCFLSKLYRIRNILHFTFFEII